MPIKDTIKEETPIKKMDSKRGGVTSTYTLTQAPQHLSIKTTQK